MRKSLLWLVLVYKHLFLLDPDWIPSPRGVYCLACIGREAPSTEEQVRWCLSFLCFTISIKMGWGYVPLFMVY
jgi:hypothetical protein